MIYIFRSCAGTFTILPDDQNPGMYQLCLGGMWLGSYETAEKAAESIPCKQTGWLDWDSRGSQDCPQSLQDWDKE
ncbi:MAG: hypothetical protein ABFD62_16465 [Syntrophaceae bacterium]